MSAVENRRVEYRNSFSPGASPAAKLARWGPAAVTFFVGTPTNGSPEAQGCGKNPLPTKVIVAERLEPFLRVSEDGFTDLNLGPSTVFELP